MTAKMSLKKIKFIVLIATFFLFGLGRWFHSAMVSRLPMDTSIGYGLAYGMLFSLLSYFLVDLVSARGRLQSKIALAKATLVYLAAITLFNFIMVHIYEIKSPAIPFLELLLSTIFLVLMLLVDKKKGTEGDYIFSDAPTIPKNYLKAHPFKTFLETILRLFPYPGPVALYRIGRASDSSPILVTGNYDLTIRRVLGVVRNLDCWLLVCNSRGINIWCSSLADHFRTEDIVAAIRKTRLGEKVRYRRLILPQLCAANISTEEIRKQTGFSSRFGPAHIKHTAPYLADSPSSHYRRVTFTWKERMEMALGCPLILCLLLLLVYSFIGWTKLAAIIPLLYIFSLLHALVYPYRIIKKTVPWSLLFGAAVFTIGHLIFSQGLGLDFTAHNIAVALGCVYLVNEFTGWSPLVKYNLLPHKKARIEVIEERCIGCRRCIQVCPKGVFAFRTERKKSAVVHLHECISCKSCFQQCPCEAIDHSEHKAEPGTFKMEADDR